MIHLNPHDIIIPPNFTNQVYNIRNNIALIKISE